MDVFQIKRLHLAGAYLAVLRRKGQDLVSGRLNGAGLMDVNMGGHSAHHALMGPEGRCNHRHVGLGPSHQEVYVSIFPFAEIADNGRRLPTIVVLPVSRCLFQVCLHQFLQDALMGAFTIIAVKTNHFLSSPFPFHGTGPTACRRSPFSRRPRSPSHHTGKASCWRPSRP